MQNINESIRERLVLALDTDNLDLACSLIDQTKKYIGVYKIGLQFLSNNGPSAFKEMQDMGIKIFYDCKYHDIPNTVAKAVKNLVRHGVEFFNIHISGGSEMIKATVNASQQAALQVNKPAPVILGVTVLSSISQQILSDELKVPDSVDNYVVHLAKFAQNNGLNGVVASVREAKNIKEACGKQFRVLCPGIRPAWAAANDQSRIATPADAFIAGADYIVLGRAVTSAPDKIEALEKIYEEIQLTTAQ